MRVREFLSSYRGRPVHVAPFADPAQGSGEHGGNHGDYLIELGMQRVLEETGVRLAAPQEAELILIRGGGTLVETYDTGPRVFREACRRFPDTPICVLPQSVYYPTRPFAEEIGQRSAPVTIFCRERYSLEHLQQDHALPALCRLELDHDLAFELEGTDLVNRVASGTPRHVLIVERGDTEHAAAGLRSRPPGFARRIINRTPIALKRPLYPLAARLRAQRVTPVRELSEQRLGEDYPELVRLPRLVRDIVLPHHEPFESFIAAITGAAAVFSTRLHVAILAAMAGKPTYLFDGAYHKFRGVYEYSLADRANVRRLEAPAGAGSR